MPVQIGKWIFFHMPKTGGSWVSRYIRKELKGDILSHWGGHARVSELPQHVLKDKVLFGTKRDPWSWYASWYRHALGSEKTRLELRVYGNGSDEFADVLRGATTIHNVPRHPGVIWTMPDEKWNEAAGEVRHQSLIRSGVGLYSWVVNHIYEGRCKLIEPQDLGTVLPIGDINIEDHPPINVRPDINALYTDELREMVWERDGAQAATLGYTPNHAHQ